MSRNHAVVQFAIWRDPEYRSLPVEAQWAYLMLLSQPHVSQAGTLPLMPGKWAKGCDGMTAATVTTALEALEAARFVFFDEDTEEALIRSFIRNDGVLRQPNVLKSAIKSALLLESDKLRAVMCFELRRITGEVSRPDIVDLLASAIVELEPSQASVTLLEPSPKGSGTLSTPEGFANPSRTPLEGHGEGEGEGEVNKVTTYQLSPSVGATPRAATEIEPVLEIAVDEPAPKAKATRGTRIPEDFMPREATIAAIRADFPAITSQDLELAHASFRDYWTAASGANASKRDWDAAWRVWMRKEFKRSRPGASGPTARERKRATAEALKDNPNPAILAAGGIAQGPSVAVGALAGGRPAPALLPALEA